MVFLFFSMYPAIGIALYCWGVMANLAATKLNISINHLKYEERLRYLKLPTLKFRCVRRDMIEVYKFFNNIYDSVTTGWLTDRHMQINYDMRVHWQSLSISDSIGYT